MTDPQELVRNYYRDQGKDMALEALAEQIEGMLEVKSHTDPSRLGYEFALELVRACQR
jgi:hypothetical protein